MYKMVVLDLDGTLLNDEKIISDENAYILSELHKTGVEIVIATGRNYFMAKKLTDKINSLSPVILSNNGSVTRTMHNDEVLNFNYLKPEYFQEIYAAGIKRNLHPIVHVNEYEKGIDIIYEQEDFENVYFGYIKKDYGRAKQIKFNNANTDNILSVCYFDEYDKLKEFVDALKHENNYNIIFNRNLRSHALLEFLNIEGCKWCSLKKYALHKNVLPEEIVSIGDDNNDIELLKNSGLGIAMINGTEDIKKAAKRISKYDNNHSGIYHELSDIFKIQ